MSEKAELLAQKLKEVADLGGTPASTQVCRTTCSSRGSLAMIAYPNLDSGFYVGGELMIPAEIRESQEIKTVREITEERKALATASREVVS